MRYRIKGEMLLDIEGEIEVGNDSDEELARALEYAQKHLRVSISPDGFRASAMIRGNYDERLKIESSVEPSLEIEDCLD